MITTEGDDVVPVTAPAPSRRVTNAQGVSPHVSSGRATTAASSTAGWR